MSSETADAVITVDRVDRVADAVHIGRRSLFIARQSVLDTRPVTPSRDLAGALQKLVRGLSDDGVEIALKVTDHVGSQPARAIANIAREVDTDVIIVGMRGFSPVHGAFVGSVTQSLLHVAPCPVLAVPPIERSVNAHDEASVATGRIESPERVRARLALSALVDAALFAAAEEVRQKLGGAGAPAPAASLVVVFVVVVAVTVTIIIVVVATMVVVVPILVVLVASVVAPFHVQQLLKLATVEKDPPALLALVDQDAVALVGAHLAVTFRASQDRCVSHLVLLVKRWRHDAVPATLPMLTQAPRLAIRSPYAWRCGSALIARRPNPTANADFRTTTYATTRIGADGRRRGATD